MSDNVYNVSYGDALSILSGTYGKLEYVHNDVLVDLVNDLANKAAGTSEPRVQSALAVAYSQVAELTSLCNCVMSIVEDEGCKLSRPYELSLPYERNDETDPVSVDMDARSCDSMPADAGDSKGRDRICVTTKQLDEYDAAIDKLSFLAVVLGNLQPVGGDRADAGLFFVLTDAISVFEDMAPKLKGLPRVPSTEV